MLCVLVGTIGFPDYGCLIGALSEVAVDAVLSNVELSTDEPFYFRFSEVPFQYLAPLLSPLEIFGNTGPKCFRTGNALLINFLVVSEGFYGLAHTKYF
jgi:hypothetical protein